MQIIIISAIGFFNLLLVFGLNITIAFSQENSTLNANTFHDKISVTKGAEILDVRTPGEYSQGFIEGAKNLDYRNPAFKNEVSKLDKTKPYFVYCLSGARSSAAANYMRSNGFQEVYDMEGGILAWQKNNLPLTTAGKISEDKISEAEYLQLVSSGTVLVDFYAPWCAPCKKMEPWLKEIAAEYKGKVQVARINIDENKQLAKQLEVNEIPVLRIYKNGKQTWDHRGIVEKSEVIPYL